MGKVPRAAYPDFLSTHSLSGSSPSSQTLGPGRISGWVWGREAGTHPGPGSLPTSATAHLPVGRLLLCYSELGVLIHLLPTKPVQDGCQNPAICNSETVNEAQRADGWALKGRLL